MGDNSWKLNFNGLTITAFHKKNSIQCIQAKSVRTYSWNSKFKEFLENSHFIAIPSLKAVAKNGNFTF